MRISPFLLIFTLIAPSLALAQTPPTAPETPPLPTASPLPSPTAATPQAAPTPAPKLVLKGRNIVPHGAVSFTSKAQGFAIGLPGKPLESKTSGVMPTGETMATSLFGWQLGLIRYAASFSRYPPKFAALLAKDPAQQVQLLDGLHMGIMGAIDSKRLGPRLQKQEELHMGSFAGREIKISYLKGAATIRARYFLTPEGIYSISAGGFKADMQQQQQAAQIDRIFDSLRILP